MSGFPMHLITMLRMCGASTLPLPIPIETIFVGAQMLQPAPQGGLDSHDILGALIPLSGSNIFLGPMKLPAIAAIRDMASPDIMGLIPHVQGLPIPIQGEGTVRMGSGTAGAGLGMMQPIFNQFQQVIGFNSLQIGELVSMGQQIIGQVANFTQIGGGAAVAQLTNLQGAPLSPGSVVTGQTSGYTFSFSNYFDSRVAIGDTANSYSGIESVTNSLVSDTGEYIVIDDYFSYYPSMNLAASVITV